MHRKKEKVGQAVIDLSARISYSRDLITEVPYTQSKRSTAYYCTVGTYGAEFFAKSGPV